MTLMKLLAILVLSRQISALFSIPLTSSLQERFPTFHDYACLPLCPPSYVNNATVETFLEKLLEFESGLVLCQDQY